MPRGEGGEPGVAAVASYVPARAVENAELAQRFGFERAFLEEKIGIERRYVCAPDEAVSDLAVAAAERLLERERVARGEIGLLIVCTQNPDYRLPATANLVQHRLGLATTTAAFDIGQGCSGYVYGLSIAGSLMQANGIRSALLVTSEAYSKVQDPADRDTAPLFGDGAAATWLRLGAPARIGRFAFGSDGSGAEELIVRAGGSRHPALACSGAGALRMNGRAIFNFMMREVPKSVERCLELNRLTRDEIDLFVFHQASRYMVEALRGALRLDPERVPVTLADGGNTVSSTIPMAIETLGGIPALAGRRLCLCGFGVGLSWASTILEVEP
ncbi:MAG TPA: ketoacyl-ACP synthase III [Planctomycetota bacterium]|nr:ketoacyl-ACP synthase III [Planctomycetota bacterium]